jgi:EmrB/QacA subfamily drug resistance transporter
VRGSGSRPSGGLRFGSAAGRWVIAASVLGSGIAAIDATVVGVALPAIGHEFHVGVAALQWVVSGYFLTLASLLLLSGSLSDRFGRKRLFCIGVVGFAAASAACGLAPSAGFLIAMRVLQGIGGALLVPGSLAILEASFAPSDRGPAIGAWAGLGAVATAAGPLLGGYLISAASWRWIFFLNLPVAVVVLLVAARHVPESKDPSAAPHVDVAGACSAVVGLGALAFALIEGPALGWSSTGIVAALALAISASGAFAFVELRSRQPMLPLRMFRERQFSSTNAITFLMYASVGGAFFLVPVQLQIGSGYSPLEAGAALLPTTIIELLFSARSGRLASRIGPRSQLIAGPFIFAASLVLLTRIPGHHSYWVFVLPAVIVMGIGVATFVAPLTATVMESAAPEHAGLASAINNDVARIGSLLAVSVLPAIAGITGTTYLHPAELSAGFRTAMVVSAIGCGLGGIVAVFTVRNPSRKVEAAASYAHCAIDAPPLRVSLPRAAKADLS